MKKGLMGAFLTGFIGSFLLTRKIFSGVASVMFAKSYPYGRMDANTDSKKHAHG